MATGRFTSEDEVLRKAMNALSIEDDGVRALEEALDLIDQGDAGIPLDEAFASVRAKYGISQDA
jgi:hypothetical protein